jgi:phospholipid/cholesterol/gamma-HCH transport system permease protein
MTSYIRLNLNILHWLFIAPLRGEFFSVGEVFHQMLRIGVRALPMVCLTSYTIGFALAMLIAQEVAPLGAHILMPHLVFVSILEQLAPLLVGVMVIGRSGSAVTAELGTMKVSEEIEALQVMAINPVQFLVVPRALAMLVMLPVVTVFGVYVGMIGTWTIGHFAMGWNTPNFILSSMEGTNVWEFYGGLIKCFVFAWLIITIACHAGLRTEGGAEGVGQSTTSSVVYSVLSMLVANALLTAVFYFAKQP